VLDVAVCEKAAAEVANHLVDGDNDAPVLVDREAFGLDMRGQDGELPVPVRPHRAPSPLSSAVPMVLPVTLGDGKHPLRGGSRTAKPRERKALGRRAGDLTMGVAKIDDCRGKR
jgi:hypothetical protein